VSRGHHDAGIFTMHAHAAQLHEQFALQESLGVNARLAVLIRLTDLQELRITALGKNVRSSAKLTVDWCCGWSG